MRVRLIDFPSIDICSLLVVYASIYPAQNLALAEGVGLSKGLDLSLRWALFCFLVVTTTRCDMRL